MEYVKKHIDIAKGAGAMTTTDHSNDWLSAGTLPDDALRQTAMVG